MSLDLLANARIVELGKVKIGRLSDQVRTSKSGSEWRPPEKLDHFIVTTMMRNGKGDLVKDDALMGRLIQRYGDLDGKLRQLPITLLSNQLEDALQAAWVWYPGKRIGAKCEDGKTLTKYMGSGGEVLDPPQHVEWKPEYAELKWRNGPMFKLHTSFSFAIAAPDARWGGVYRFRTTSRISGEQLLSTLRQVQVLTHGCLRGMPLRLVVRPMQVAPDGRPTTVYVVHAELRGDDLQQIQQMALDQRRVEAQFSGEIMAAETQFRRLLPPPGSIEESDEDVEDAAAEFHAPPVDAGEPVPPATPDPLLVGVEAKPPSLQDEPPANWQPGEDPWGESEPKPPKVSPGWTADGKQDEETATDLFGPAPTDHSTRGAGVP